MDNKRTHCLQWVLILQICFSSHCIQALAPYPLGRLLCSQRACPSYTLNGISVIFGSPLILFLHQYLSRYSFCLLLGFGELYNCAVIRTINLPQNNIKLYLIKRHINVFLSASYVIIIADFCPFVKNLAIYDILMSFYVVFWTNYDFDKSFSGFWCGIGSELTASTVGVCEGLTGSVGCSVDVGTDSTDTEEGFSVGTAGVVGSTNR